MTRDEAERAARERGRAWHEWLDRARTDVRIAVRSLRRSPGFVIGVCAILAIGIGMTATMYTVYKVVLIDRLPIETQDRLVVMHPIDHHGTHLDAPLPYLAEIARDSALFSGVAGTYHPGAQPLPLMDGTTPIELREAAATANYFDVLGMRAERGRLFAPADGKRGAAPVIVLSHAAWQQRFGGDPNVIGRTLVIPYTEQRARIVGIAPPGFAYPVGAEAWVQLAPDGTEQVDVIARLARGVTVDAARAGLLALAHRVNPFASTSPGNGKPPVTVEVDDVEAHPLTDTLLGGIRPALVALTLAVGLLLLIACVNVGSLMLGRFLARRREIVVRRAIGASQGDVARLLLVESALLAIAGGALGTTFSIAAIRVIARLAPTALPRVDALAHVDAPLGVAAIISVVAVLVFGVVPSIAASRVSSYALLRADARAGVEGRSSRRARRWLVATQMALAVVLITGAGLLVRTLVQLESQDLGYQPEHLSMLSFTGPQSDLPNPDRIYQAARQLTARIEATPGIVAATPIESPPFKGQSFFIMPLVPASATADERDHAPYVPFEFVGSGYFRTFGVPIREGRGLLPSDTKTAEKVVVLSETMAKRLFPHESAVGKQLMNAKDASKVLWTVVGVASDTHFRDLKNTGPVAYFNSDQVEPFWNGYIAVRTRGSLAAMLPAIRAAAHDANPHLVMYDATTMDALLDGPMAQPRLDALLLTGFALVALLLSAIGLYGVMSGAVRQQTRDIGVRVALGATPHDVRRLVLGDALAVIGAGAVAGLGVAMFASRFLASQLFGVTPLDPVSLAGAAALLVALGLIAAYLPARRATRIDPAQALRGD